MDKGLRDGQRGGTSYVWLEDYQNLWLRGSGFDCRAQEGLRVGSSGFSSLLMPK